MPQPVLLYFDYSSVTLILSKRGVQIGETAASVVVLALSGALRQSRTTPSVFQHGRLPRDRRAGAECCRKLDAGRGRSAPERSKRTPRTRLRRFF